MRGLTRKREGPDTLEREHANDASFHDPEVVRALSDCTTNELNPLSA